MLTLLDTCLKFGAVVEEALCLAKACITKGIPNLQQKHIFDCQV